MLTETPLRNDPDTVSDERPHAVVIGSGFGGLAAAVRLGARGYRVTVLEKLDAPGGRAYVFRQDGFTFDAGPTIITAPFVLEDLWRLAGRRLQDDVDLVKLDPFYKLRFADGTWMSCNDDPADMRAEVARLSPDDVPGYERLLAKSEAIFKVGFEEFAHVPFNSLWDMVKVLPGFVSLRADRSVYGLVKRHVRDERLRIAFSFHPLFIGGNPLRATALYHLIAHLEKEWGIRYVRGGTGQLVQGLVKLIEGQGGSVRCRHDVKAITLRDRRATGVQLASGETMRADIVVSNADSAWTYQHLLPAGASRRWTARRVARSSFSPGVFVWYFGTNRQYSEVDHHTILMGPRYEGLLRDIFRHKRLTDDFSLYVHRPSATDEKVAPPGCDAFYVLSVVPNLAGGVDWTREAEPYRRKIEAYLEETLLPGLGNAVVTSRVSTPLDFAHRLNAPQGAAFGLEPLLTQSAWFRPCNRSEDVERLYLVGAGTHPGAGVPGVISSARVLDALVPDATALV
ncbi:MAG: phytoene desaturase [Pseudomonadota bacterium]